jgi:hypothetical protein
MSNKLVNELYDVTSSHEGGGVVDDAVDAVVGFGKSVLNGVGELLGVGGEAVKDSATGAENVVAVVGQGVTKTGREVTGVVDAVKNVFGMGGSQQVGGFGLPESLEATEAPPQQLGGYGYGMDDESSSDSDDLDYQLGGFGLPDQLEATEAAPMVGGGCGCEGGDEYGLTEQAGGFGLPDFLEDTELPPSM